MMPSVTPEILLPPVWPPPRSLATTSGISVDVFSSPYLDVSVQAVPHIYLFDSVYVTLAGGFPHSEIYGSRLICSSPQLIAAYHVLHRLLMPRHSPCALFSLTLVDSRPACSAFTPFRAECSDAVGISSSNQNPLRWAFDLVWRTIFYRFDISLTNQRKVQYWFSN